MARESYFRQPDMVEFLLAENLALKMLLYEKGIMETEEFKEYKARAAKILKERTESHIDQWKKTHPDVVRLFQEAADRTTQPDLHPDAEGRVVV
jgi:hypothetical protein